MEHCFRTALCVFVLLGCLQAAPTSTLPDKEDFRLESLKKITCKGNMTFKCPKDVTESGLTEIIREALVTASKSCGCNNCGYALTSLDDLKVPSAAANAAICTRGAGSLTFNNFVLEFERIIEKTYSNS